jgi:hypothetical protein
VRKRLFIPAIHKYTGRLYKPNLIVAHATAGRKDKQESAEGVAHYFQNPNSGGSTQWVSDDVVDVRCVADEDTCWGAKNHNSNGLHFEICGHPDWSRAEWLEHIEAIKGSAVLMAEAMTKHRIPFVYPAPIVNGRAQNGIHGHYGLPGNDHTDPAPGPGRHGGFPWDVLLSEIKKNLGLGHTVGTSKPAQALTRAAELRKREKVIVRFQYADGTYRIWRGWAQAQSVLKYLADGQPLKDTTVVDINWQGNWFPKDQQKSRNIANSIYSRFA